MTQFEILDGMGYLCNIHNIQFEVNEFGVIIRKYFNFGGKPYNFNQAFSFEIFKRKDLKECVLEFERRLEIELDKAESEEEE